MAGMIFYESFYVALQQLTDADRLAAYDAICGYGITGELPEVDGIVMAVFQMAKPQIDANNKRREDGKKGGRPRKTEEETSGFVNVKPVVLQNEEIEKPKEKVKVKEKVKEKVNAKEKVKYPHGEFGNVRLTESEYTKLKFEFGDERTDEAIKFLDDYIEEKGYKSKSHYMAMRRWVFGAVDERRGRKNTQRQVDNAESWFAALQEVQCDDDRGGQNFSNDTDGVPVLSSTG